MNDVTTLGDHLAIMRRRWLLVVLMVVLGAAAGVGFSLTQSPLQRATATVLLEPTKTSTSATVMDPDEVATQAGVIGSVPVAQRVIDDLGLDTTPDDLIASVTVEQVEQTRTVQVTADRSSAEEAVAVANGFATQYIELQKEQAVEVSTSTSDGLIAQISTLRTELSGVRDDLDAGGLTTQREQALEAQEQSLVTRIAELRIEITTAREEAAAVTPGGQLLREAELPGETVQPLPVRAGVFGGVVGLVLGVLLAYARDRVDDRIRDEDLLRRVAGGVPVVGRIPRETGDRSRPVTLLAPHSPPSEAYHSLNANVRFLLDQARSGGRGEVLIVTSAVPAEGKTSVSANIAVAAAGVGLRVVLVDADLRSPDIGNRTGLESPWGLSHVLSGQVELDKAVLEGEDLDIPNLRLVLAGPVPPNPVELLARPQMRAVLEELRRSADLVVVDTAPILRVADTLELVRDAELTIVSARHGASRARDVSAAVARIGQVGGSVSGIALCAVPRREETYGYGEAAAAAAAG